MERSKLDELIRDKNERLERSALRTAESLIEAITEHQGIIRKSEKAISGLREELQTLEIDQLDAKSVLGE